MIIASSANWSTKSSHKCFVIILSNVIFIYPQNRITYHTKDPELKELYQKEITVDHSECCKSKNRRRDKKDKEEVKKKEPEDKKEKEVKKSPIPIANVMTKIPPTIQVISLFVK